MPINVNYLGAYQRRAVKFMTEIVPERIIGKEWEYVRSLLAGSLLIGFNCLLNEELAKVIAEKAMQELKKMQDYSGKIL